MNGAQIHLALNHFPIAGIILTFPILLWGLLAKKDQIKSVGIALAIVSALAGFVVMETGEGAEEVVEHKPGVTKNLIHEHEEAAEAAIVAIHLTAALGIAWVIMNKLNKDHKDKVILAMLLTSLVGSGLIARAAHEGGKIRHDEIRGGEGSLVKATANETNEAKEGNEAKEEKH